MSTGPPVEASVTTPEAVKAFAPQPGIGLPLAVGTFGFSVLVLGLPTSRIISPDALGIFVPVAFGTGALGLFIGACGSIGLTTSLAEVLRCSTLASSSRLR